ncbi:MAG TPA: ATP-binding protein [Roseiflexaceae bacterium]|nr:ATP-binding protein [Roseiflexaceae bacterium]
MSDRANSIRFRLNNALQSMWREQRRSTLRGKTLLIVVSTLAVLLAILAIPPRLFLLGSFLELEARDVRTNVERARNALPDRVRSIHETNGGFSFWDEMYAFADGGDPTDVVASFTDDVFRDSRINMVLVLNAQGQTLYDRTFDLANGQPIAVPERFQNMPADDPLLAFVDETGNHSGLILLPEGPMLLSSRPIVRSDGSGPVRGAVIMGRYLNAAEIADLSSTLRLRMEFYQPGAPLPPDLQAVAADLRPDGTATVNPLNDQQIAGYAAIPTLEGPSLLMRVETDRSIYAQWQAGMRYFLLALLLAGVVFGVAVLALLELVVLAPLSRLNAGLQRIGARRDLAARVSVRGSDELADLGQTINAMLAELEQAQVERRQANEAQERIRLQEENIRAKREFISVVSHELRTPLTPIRGFVDLMLLDQDNRLSEEQHEFLNLIKANAVRMSMLIDDLLELGRMEANKMEINLAPVDLGAMISETLAMLQPEIERKQLTRVQQVDPQLPLIDADPRRIQQVLANLVSNAVKYTPDGGWIQVSAVPADEGCVEIRVEDNGIGISEEQQALLFTPFYRAENAVRSTTSGTGLGLTITKAFVELHGGRIWVQSTEGVGTTFVVSLPIHALPPEPPTTHPEDQPERAARRSIRSESRSTVLIG